MYCLKVWQSKGLPDKNDMSGRHVIEKSRNEALCASQKKGRSPMCIACWRREGVTTSGTCSPVCHDRTSTARSVQATHHQPLSPPYGGGRQCSVYCLKVWQSKGLPDKNDMSGRHVIEKSRNEALCASQKKGRSPMCIACWRREGVTDLIDY